MTGKSVPEGRRALGSLLGAGALAVLVASSVAACASSSPASAAGSSGAPSSGGSVIVSPSSSPSPAATPSSASTSPSTAATSPGATGINPGGAMVVAPQTQLPSPPAGQKLTAFDSVTRNSDGTILYLGLFSQGGSCGQYDVVLEQSASSVGLGLVHLSSERQVCPMYVAHMSVEAKLSAPLDGRPVVDLATGQRVQVSLT